MLGLVQNFWNTLIVFLSGEGSPESRYIVPLGTFLLSRIRNYYYKRTCNRTVVVFLNEEIRFLVCCCVVGSCWNLRKPFLVKVKYSVENVNYWVGYRFASRVYKFNLLLF